MSSRLVLGFVLSAITGTASVAAQEPALRPVASYLSTNGESVSDSRYIARRCAALYMLLGAKSRERGALSVAENLDRGAQLFLTIARQADVQMGTSEAKANEVTLAAISNVMDVLIDRMNRNMAVGGSFIVGDSLLESDVRACGEIAEHLNQRSDGR